MKIDVMRVPQNIKLFKRLNKVLSILKLSGVNLPGGGVLPYMGLGAAVKGMAFKQFTLG